MCACCRQFTSKFTNTLLLLLGVASVVLSIYALVHVQDDNENSPTTNSQDVKTGKNEKEGAWVYYLSTVLGFFMIFVATLTIRCKCPDPDACYGCRLACHGVMACIMLLSQIVVVIIVCVKNTKIFIPQGVPQELQFCYKFWKDNLQWVEIFILLVEVVGIFVECCCCCCQEEGGGHSEPLVKSYSPLVLSNMPLILPNEQLLLDNHANQCNPNNWRYAGHSRYYSGVGSMADLNNHANQLNPNNWRFGMV